MTVTVYSTPSCQACRQTKRHLDKLGIPFTEKSFEDDAADLEAARYLGMMTAPVVCVTKPDGEHVWWDGYRDERLNELGRCDG